MTQAGDNADNGRTDEELLAAAQGGDESAFEALVRRYHGELLTFLMRFVRRRAAAEDLFQETFLQVYLSSDSFDPTRRFKPWLFTIAANKARDQLRKNKRRATVPLTASVNRGEDGGPEFIDLMEADLPLPTQNLEDAETREMVRDVMEALPDHLREVMLLAYFNRFAYKEIAEMLGIPLGTVKSRLHAAVGTFAQLWKARHGEQPR
mgnify:CR=1 FL=1